LLDYSLSRQQGNNDVLTGLDNLSAVFINIRPLESQLSFVLLLLLRPPPNSPPALRMRGGGGEAAGLALREKESCVRLFLHSIQLEFRAAGGRLNFLFQIFVF
jgi:hypothetical protein